MPDVLVIIITHDDLIIQLIR